MPAPINADRDVVLARVTEILNLCDPGTYSKTLSTRNKTRNVDAIAAATDEAGLMILTCIGERPNEFRSLLADEATVANSGDALPPHIGPPLSVEIQATVDSDWAPAEKSDYRKIDSYRTNPENVYDAIAHDQPGSRLSGKYDIWGDRFFFTGAAARVDLVAPPTTDSLIYIPVHMQSIWVRLAVGNNGKAGTGDYDSGLIAAYWKQGMDDLEAWKAGKRAFSEVDEPSPVDTHAVQ